MFRLMFYKANFFLTIWTACPGFNPLGQATEQLYTERHMYAFALSSKNFSLSSLYSSRESTIHRYACIKIAGPKYSCWFHQYERQAVWQHAHKMHSYIPSSFFLSS